MVKMNQMYRRSAGLSRINPLSQEFFASSSVNEDVVSSFSARRHPAAFTLQENTHIYVQLDRLLSHPTGFYLVRPMWFFFFFFYFYIIAECVFNVEKYVAKLPFWRQNGGKWAAPATPQINTVCLCVSCRRPHPTKLPLKSRYKKQIPFTHQISLKRDKLHCYRKTCSHQRNERRGSSAANPSTEINYPS